MSNTVLGTKMRLFFRVSVCPSGNVTGTSSQIVVIGGAAEMNRSFTQPWPMPPGLAVARM